MFRLIFWLHGEKNVIVESKHMLLATHKSAVVDRWVNSFRLERIADITAVKDTILIKHFSGYNGVVSSRASKQ